MILSTLLIIVIILIGLSVHEFAHAWMANRLGDPTSRLEGRLTLNPIAHWDPIGTTLLVGLIFLRGLGMPAFVFGWGKPVPIDERYFKNPRYDSIKTALAGPLSNIIMAIILALLIRLVIPYGSLLFYVAASGVTVNIFLALFNLIPVPPLDGSRILRAVLSEEEYFKFEQLSNFFVIGLIALFFIAPGLLGNLVEKIVGLLIP